MKAGPCGQAFKDWEKCVDEAHKGEQDIVAKCTGPTRALKECMEANTEYYAPVLETDDTKEALDAEKEERSEAVGGKSKEDAREAEVRGFANCDELPICERLVKSAVCYQLRHLRVRKGSK
jgi:hypothetical protein